MRDVILSLPLIRMLPAGEERAKRGHHDELPIRSLKMTRDGETFYVAIGPVDHGGPEEELWEFLLVVR
jgi:hypothetical protein